MELPYIPEKRKDGRLSTQIRPFSVEFGVLKSCDGSARFAAGDTKVLIGIQGPRAPRSVRAEDPDAALLEVIVQPSSNAYGAAEAALEADIRAVFQSVVALKAHPRTVITIIIQIIHDDGSLLAAAVNATTLALCDAGVPLHALAVAAANVKSSARTDEDAFLLDPTHGEECHRGVLSTKVSLSTDLEESLLLREYGFLSEAERGLSHEMLTAGCKIVAGFQQVALRKKVAKDILK